ncbi:hypothetical protein ACLOJK_004288 [Asimina triloba]
MVLHHLSRRLPSASSTMAFGLLIEPTQINCDDDPFQIRQPPTSDGDDSTVPTTAATASFVSDIPINGRPSHRQQRADPRSGEAASHRQQQQHAGTVPSPSSPTKSPPLPPIDHLIQSRRNHHHGPIFIDTTNGSDPSIDSSKGVDDHLFRRHHLTVYSPPKPAMSPPPPPIMIIGINTPFRRWTAGDHHPLHLRPPLPPSMVAVNPSPLRPHY